MDRGWRRRLHGLISPDLLDGCPPQAMPAMDDDVSELPTEPGGTGTQTACAREENRGDFQHGQIRAYLRLAPHHMPLRFLGHFRGPHDHGGPPAQALERAGSVRPTRIAKSRVLCSDTLLMRSFTRRRICLRRKNTLQASGDEVRAIRYQRASGVTVSGLDVSLIVGRRPVRPPPSQGKRWHFRTCLKLTCDPVYAARQFHHAIGDNPTLLLQVPRARTRADS